MVMELTVARGERLHAGHIRRAASSAFLLAGTPLPCSDEEFSKQSRRQRPTCTVDCSHKIGRAIRRQSLQALQQRRDGHEDSPDDERLGPSEADKRRNREIADEVVEPPNRAPCGVPILRAQGNNHEQDHDGHAANFQGFFQH